MEIVSLLNSIIGVWKLNKHYHGYLFINEEMRKTHTFSRKFLKKVNNLLLVFFRILRFFDIVFLISSLLFLQVS